MGRLVACLSGCALLLAACGGGPAPSAGGGSRPSVKRVPLPAGPLPAHVTKMVCDGESRRKIARVLGIGADVPPPTWQRRAHLYDCDFEYPTGRMVLTVKELSSWQETFSYFRGLARRYGRIDTLGNLGQGAFVTRGGSVVVRKDWKVLLVDVSGLPKEIGSPPTTPAGVAYSVAALILGCWAGD